MNLFVLDVDPEMAAQYHCDKHVVKMTLETAQLLCTAVHELGFSFPGQYRPTHVNHPCAIWVRQTRGNAFWALELLQQLGVEYTHRYGRVHASTALLEPLRACLHYAEFPDMAMTPFAQAMPEEYRDPDPVKAYRQYYLGEKLRMMEYTDRATPYWAFDAVMEYQQS